MPSRLPPFQKEQEAGIMADKKNEPKVEYTKSTAQLDAERRVEEAKKDEAPQVPGHLSSVQPTYGVEEDGGYLGTDPVYRNAADVRQEPLSSDEDWQRQDVTTQADAGEENLPYVPGHVGTGAPKLEAHGPVTSTSTVQPVDESTKQSAAPRVATPGTK